MFGEYLHLAVTKAIDYEYYTENPLDIIIVHVFVFPMLSLFKTLIRMVP